MFVNPFEAETSELSAPDVTLRASAIAPLGGDVAASAVIGGTEGPDFIVGTDSFDFINALGGDDLVFGLGGDDRISGGLGSDTIDGGFGNDVLVGDGGNDHLIGGQGDDDLSGSAGNDTLEGNADNDSLTGGDGDDTLNGGDGNDFFFGNFSGIDVMLGGGGSDTFAMLAAGTPTSRTDVQGGEGVDIVTYITALNGVVVDLTDQTRNSVDAFGHTFIDVETFILSEQRDDFRGSDAAETVFGRGGDDVLEGGAGADSINGGEGSDTASYDQALAAVSIDLTKSSSTWTGDAQGDILTSIEDFQLTAFADVFRGDNTANIVNAGAGDDTILGNGGNDQLVGRGGNDIIQGGGGNDFISGDGPNATGNDYLLGNAGDDFISGDAGNDKIGGGVGNDIIYGGDGGDTLLGNEGADIFLYASVTQSQRGGDKQLDQIIDFTQGQDRIDLSLIGQVPGGDQAFTFLADPANHTGDWTNLVWGITDTRGVTTVFASTDADADAEMSIYMSHGYTFTAGDFIL